MVLRVARGLFRLWLVLSVLWIGGVGIATWWTFPEDNPIVRDICAKANDAEQCAGLLRAAGKNPFEAFDPEERRTAIQFASIEAFVPPVFVLALGSALVWAFRGFRVNAPP
jgi:hypothetical protein